MPAVVLHRPQIAENVGSVARILANFGLSDLRLVAPRPALDDPRAVAAAAGGRAVLDAARVFPDLAAACADLQHVYATTALPRPVAKAVLSPREAAAALRAAAPRRCGLVFGPEPSGLSTAELALADALVHIPTDPACRALNLAQAVCVLVWEWTAATSPPSPPTLPEPAGRATFDAAFDAIVDRAVAAGWAPEPALRPRVVRHLRSLLHRAAPSPAELNTLRGLVETLARSAPEQPEHGEEPHPDRG